MFSTSIDSRVDSVPIGSGMYSVIASAPGGGARIARAALPSWHWPVDTAMQSLAAPGVPYSPGRYCVVVHGHHCAGSAACAALGGAPPARRLDRVPRRDRREARPRHRAAAALQLEHAAAAFLERAEVGAEAVVDERRRVVRVDRRQHGVATGVDRQPRDDVRVVGRDAPTRAWTIASPSSTIGRAVVL